MGGAQAGEVASGARRGRAARRQRRRRRASARVVELIQEANRRVHERATTDAAASGMGTTMTAALVEPGGHGDDRARRRLARLPAARTGALEQLTDDHSLVAELVRRGELSPAEAEVHPQRSVITRALGTDPDVDVDTFSVVARAGDVFLLCSRRPLVHGRRGRDRADHVRTTASDLEAGATRADRGGERAGGEDNITAVLFELVEASRTESRTSERASTRRARRASAGRRGHAAPEDDLAVPPAALDGHAAVADTIVVSAAALADAREIAAAAAAARRAGGRPRHGDCSPRW